MAGTHEPRPFVELAVVGVDVDDAVAERNPGDFGSVPLVSQRDVPHGRELGFGDHEPVPPLPEVQGADDDGHGGGDRRHERDLVGMGADQPRESRLGAVDLDHPRVPVHHVSVPRVAVPLECVPGRVTHRRVRAVAQERRWRGAAERRDAAAPGLEVVFGTFRRHAPILHKTGQVPSLTSQRPLPPPVLPRPSPPHILARK